MQNVVWRWTLHMLVRSVLYVVSKSWQPIYFRKVFRKENVWLQFPGLGHIRCEGHSLFRQSLMSSGLIFLEGVWKPLHDSDIRQYGRVQAMIGSSESGTITSRGGHVICEYR
jgi:hypothetical protein